MRYLNEEFLFAPFCLLVCLVDWYLMRCFILHYNVLSIGLSIIQLLQHRIATLDRPTKNRDQKHKQKIKKNTFLTNENVDVASPAKSYHCTKPISKPPPQHLTSASAKSKDHEHHTHHHPPPPPPHKYQQPPLSPPVPYRPPTKAPPPAPST